MNWLLDTNVVIHLGNGRPRSVAARYDTTGPLTLAVSTVTIAELWYGGARDANPEARRARWERVLAPLRVLDFDRRAAVIAGGLRHALRHAPIGQNDLHIAATALANGCGVVTANVREFSRVAGLAAEDWTAG